MKEQVPCETCHKVYYLSKHNPDYKFYCSDKCFLEGLENA